VASSDTVHSFVHQYPARMAAIVGAALLALGAVLGSLGQSVLLPLAVVVLLLAAMAGLGSRGVKEYEAYRRSGMEAVDGMTDRQFALLLEHCFANKGYRVSRLSTRGHAGADLLLDDSRGRTVVQVKRWHGVVHHDAVQQAALAMAHYGVARALVVTSSNYSENAVTVANSNGVTLWNRANVAVELAALPGRPNRSGLVQFSSDLRAGVRICQGFLATLFVVLLATSTGQRRRRRAKAGVRRS
jgi:restriction system protein